MQAFAITSLRTTGSVISSETSDARSAPTLLVPRPRKDGAGATPANSVRRAHRPSGAKEPVSRHRAWGEKTDLSMTLHGLGWGIK